MHVLKQSEQTNTTSRGGGRLGGGGPSPHPLIPSSPHPLIPSCPPFLPPPWLPWLQHYWGEARVWHDSRHDCIHLQRQVPAPCMPAAPISVDPPPPTPLFFTHTQHPPPTHTCTRAHKGYQCSVVLAAFVCGHVCTTCTFNAPSCRHLCCCHFFMMERWRRSFMPPPLLYAPPRVAPLPTLCHPFICMSPFLTRAWVGAALAPTVKLCTCVYSTCTPSLLRFGLHC